MMPFISFDRSVQELGFEFRDGSVRVRLDDRAGLDQVVLAHAAEFDQGVLFSSDMSEEAERVVQAALFELSEQG